ncbi:MAG TPA: CRISPR-associated endoribonuclease Cas6 [Cyanobacteria bacterium UBA8803]|nr:CRISPR-associated endoribonuclease Cas6 [Cyanobacteria bacterium UBA9273]HBL59762.1 CRISPR-associated endoribonuclease Cas6 [Cyanobacteria bacterium UBA8803]
MPHSLILNLLPLSPIPPQFLSGRHLHALFLNLVSSVDRKLGDYLHDAKPDKAFTLSPLQVLSTPKLGIKSQRHILQWEHTKVIPTGKPCWWRVSLLDDTLFSQLTHLWLNLNPEHPWHLGPADLQITSILGTPQSTQPWANACSYAQLYDHAAEGDRQIDLAFCTPTAFRQSQFDCALPTRDLVFNSLINRWNQYSGIELPKTLVEHIFPSFFDIHTQVAVDSRSKFIGCVGVINFRIMGEVEPLVIKQINALADFALYSGIGRKTPMGMGMIRRLYPA